jgi:Tfp pilus assembly protein PilN
MSAPSELSFLPDDYLERKAQRRTNFICAVLFLFVVGGIGGAFAVSEQGRRQLHEEQRSVDRQYAEAAKPLEQFRQMQEKQRKMAHQAELSASLLEKVPRSYVLAEITNSLPSGLSLTDLTLDSKARQTVALAAAPKTAYEARKAEREKKLKGEQEAAAPKQYDVYLKLAGVAGTDVQVAQLISRLSRSRLFKDVNLMISEEHIQKDVKLRRFQIELMLDPSAEVQP